MPLTLHRWGRNTSCPITLGDSLRAQELKKLQQHQDNARKTLSPPVDAIRKPDVVRSSAELKAIEANSSRKEQCAGGMRLDQCAPSRNSTTLTVSTRTNMSRNSELFLT